MRKVYTVALCLASAYIAFICGASTSKGSPVYMTAAHIDSKTLPGYTWIYSDTNRDTAYYLKNDYVYTYPDVGERVIIGGNTCKVTSIQNGVGFYVECANAYRGMSGARVLNKRGVEIGFVSSSKPNGELLCISIR